MDDAALVGGVLYHARDPARAADALVELLTAPSLTDGEVRRHGFEPSLVGALRHALPADRRALELACAKGAAWVLGRRSAERTDRWEPVATLPPDAGLPSGLRRTTAETLIVLITEATRSLRFTAPYVDAAGLGVLADALVASTTRGVDVELFEPRWEAAPQAVAEFCSAVEHHGDTRHLTVVRLAPDAPFAHLKVAVADGTTAYIGSANITGAGLTGRNLELGVMVHGTDVAVIELVLDLYRA